MTPARRKQARLARILTIRRTALRVAETALGAAGARANSAQARIHAVQMLITTAGTPDGETAIATLRGGATLRALLRPALDAAADGARDATRAQQLAAQRMAAADARHSRTLRDFTQAQSAAEREAEERESAERPPATLRRPR